MPNPNLKKELMELIDSLPPHEGKTFEEALADHLLTNGWAKPVRCGECRLHECDCPLDTHPYMTPDDGFCYCGKPALHAHWKKEIEDGMYWYACSNCGGHIPQTRWNHDLFSDFCPHCGAVMNAANPNKTED